MWVRLLRIWTRAPHTEFCLIQHWTDIYKSQKHNSSIFSCKTKTLTLVFPHHCRIVLACMGILGLSLLHIKSSVWTGSLCKVVWDDFGCELVLYKWGWISKDHLRPNLDLFHHCRSPWNLIRLEASCDFRFLHKVVLFDRRREEYFYPHLIHCDSNRHITKCKSDVIWRWHPGVCCCLCHGSCLTVFVQAILLIYITDQVSPQTQKRYSVVYCS